MAKTLEKGPQKIQEICNLLKKEALDPGKQEGAEIIKQAQEQAEQIVQAARKQAEDLVAQAHQTMEQERNVFKSALEQSSKQCMEALRQSIENQLFNHHLEEILKHHIADPKVIAEMIQGLLKALEKDGVRTDLMAVIPKIVTVQSINALLAQSILDKLKDHSVEVGDFAGGVQIKLVDKQLTLDMSDKALKELLASFVRKDFRKLIFG